MLNLPRGYLARSSIIDEMDFHLAKAAVAAGLVVDVPDGLIIPSHAEGYHGGRYEDAPGSSVKVGFKRKGKAARIEGLLHIGRGRPFLVPLFGGIPPRKNPTATHAAILILPLDGRPFMGSRTCNLPPMGEFLIRRVAQLRLRV